MQINREAPVIYEHEIDIEAPPQRVWDIQTNVQAWPRWLPAVSDVDLEAQPGVGVSFTWTAGNTRLTSTFDQVDPLSVISWSGTARGAKAIHVWRFVETETGTRVRTEESIEGWPVRFLKSYFQKTLEVTLVDWLTALKTEAERR